MADLIRTVAERIGRTTGVALRTLGLGGPRSTVVTVAADQDAALIATVAALRRIGARITRYDGDDGALEARIAGDLVTVRATGAGSEFMGGLSMPPTLVRRGLTPPAYSPGPARGAPRQSRGGPRPPDSFTGSEITMLAVSTDAPGGRRLLRRFRRELAQPAAAVNASAHAGGP